MKWNIAKGINKKTQAQAIALYKIYFCNGTHK